MGLSNKCRNVHACVCVRSLAQPHKNASIHCKVTQLKLLTGQRMKHCCVLLLVLVAAEQIAYTFGLLNVVGNCGGGGASAGAAVVVIVGVDILLYESEKQKHSYMYTGYGCCLK